MFIGLVKFRGKVGRETIAENLRGIEAEEKEGFRYHDVYWTLGPYDAVVLFEAPDERAAMKSILSRAEWADTTTLVAVPAGEARSLVG